MSAAKPAPDRRAVLGGSLGLAAAVAATAAPAALAQAEGHSTDGRDASLLAVCAAYIAAELRWTEIDAFGDQALNCYVAPPVPHVLLHQPERDTWEVCYDPRRLDSVEVDGAWHKHYASEKDVPALRWKIGVWRKHGTGRDVVDRAEAIIAALDAYVPEVLRAEDAAGVTVFHEMTRENQARLDELLREITTTPATTMQGFIAKARAATFEIGGAGGLEWLAGDALPRLLAEERDSEVYQRRTLAIVMSVVVDAARLGLPAPVATSEAA